MSVSPSAIPRKKSAPSMLAVMQDRYGTSAVLAKRNVARPAISETHGLIEVRAAGEFEG